jgi:hypothetical protein
MVQSVLGIFSMPSPMHDTDRSRRSRRSISTRWWVFAGSRGDTFDHNISAAVAVPDALDKILTPARLARQHDLAGVAPSG